MKCIRAVAGSFAILAVVASTSAWSADPAADSNAAGNDRQGVDLGSHRSESPIDRTQDRDRRDQQPLEQRRRRWTQ